MENQQQLASILLLTVWHLTQTNSVSLQLSAQRGQRAQTEPVRKQQRTHQRMATQPTFFLGMFPVSLQQVGQGDPLPLLSLPPTVMMVGPAACCGGGAYMGAGAIMGAPQAGAIGAPYPGAPYIFSQQIIITSTSFHCNIYQWNFQKKMGNTKEIFPQTKPFYYWSFSGKNNCFQSNLEKSFF